MKKLFHVSAILQLDMVVLAEDAQQAMAVGNDSFSTELMNSGNDPTLRANEIKKVDDLPWDTEDCDMTPPYGPVGDYGNGCDTPQFSVTEYMKMLGIE